jgi:hypothetical protein
MTEEEKKEIIKKLKNEAYMLIFAIFIFLISFFSGCFRF